MWSVVDYLANCSCAVYVVHLMDASVELALVEAVDKFRVSLPLGGEDALTLSRD